MEGGDRAPQEDQQRRRMKLPASENRPQPNQKCPRCESTETKFCYFNNYNTNQPRYYCKNCKRYWTQGGTLRNVPFGGGCRRGKRAKTAPSSGGEKSGVDFSSAQPAPPSLAVGNIGGLLAQPRSYFPAGGPGGAMGAMQQQQQVSFSQPQLSFGGGGGSSNIDLLQGFNNVLNPYMARSQPILHQQNGQYYSYQGLSTHRQPIGQPNRPIGWAARPPMNHPNATNNHRVSTTNANIFLDNNNPINGSSGGVPDSSAIGWATQLPGFGIPPA